MVEFKKGNVTIDQWKNISLRDLKPMESIKIKLHKGNRSFKKDMPAGVSKAGKPYQAFSTFSLGCEYDGQEVYLKFTQEKLARELESYSVGDTVEIIAMPHPKGKTIITSKVD